MTITTTNKSSRESRRPVRDRGYSKRDQRLRRQEEPKTASAVFTNVAPSTARKLRSGEHEVHGLSRLPKVFGRVEPSENRRTAAFVSGVKAIVPVLLALIPFAVAFGATAMGGGLSTLETLAMSVFVFAGAAQLAVVPLISAGASVAVVVLTVLVINLRLTLYSASLAPHFGRLPAGWKSLISYLLTDQAYAATITRFDDGRTKEPDKRWYYLGVALAIWVTWQAATMLGVFVGSWASEGWSLDFVLPLTFIALAFPAIKDRTTTAAALSAGTTAVFAAAMPLNLGLMTAALAGVVSGLIAESVAQRRQR